MLDQNLMNNIKLFILADITFSLLSFSQRNRHVFLKIGHLHFFLMWLEIALMDLDSELLNIALN
jgi:hypothetical protein